MSELQLSAEVGHEAKQTYDSALCILLVCKQVVSRLYMAGYCRMVSIVALLIVPVFKSTKK
jgi:hypothetical protein